MSFIAFAVAALLSIQATPDQDAAAAAPTPAPEAAPRAASSPVRAISARPQQHAAAGQETRRVCGFEREMGSSIQRRVCRDVPVGRNDEAAEMLRRQQGALPLSGN